MLLKVIVIVLGSFALSSWIPATATEQLNSDVYRTTSGTIIEVVEVPGVGRCIITPSNTECDWKDR